MSCNFFENRTYRQMAGDVMVGALYGARNGLVAGLALSAVGAVSFSLGTVGAMAAACALGAAIVILPVLALHRYFKDSKPCCAFGLLVGTLLFKTAMAFMVGCIATA